MSDEKIRQMVREELAAVKDELISGVRRRLLEAELGDDAVLTEQQAAELLHVSRKTLAKRRRAGEILTGSFGKSPRYTLGTIRKICRTIARSD